MVNTIPDLHFIGDSQTFALYTYEPVGEADQNDLFSGQDEVINGYRRKDNITNATLASYRAIYNDQGIEKEDIFFYVYGLLHSEEYKTNYKSDLAKQLPKIPHVKDFWGFSAAGRQLSDLHINYESVDPFPITEVSRSEVGSDFDFYRIRKLSFGSRSDKSTLTFNDHISLTGIPDDTFKYQVNGRSALEWIIDRYQVRTHKDSQISNDPNKYSEEVEDPRYILDLIKRIVTVSVETVRIIRGLPPLDIIG